jgi:protocatechuate 3,4-dioxygenase beta subunit
MVRLGQLAVGALALAVPVRFARAGTGRAVVTPTPAQVEGPYYPKTKPADDDWNLLRVGAGAAPAGEPLELGGTVFDIKGNPVPGARVEIWQCDDGGVYDHPRDANLAARDRRFQGFGALLTDAEGGYRFLTIMPVPYAGRPPHIHVKVLRDGHQGLTTQLYLKDHPANDRDGLFGMILYPGQDELLIDPRDALLDNGMRGKAARYDFVIP